MEPEGLLPSSQEPAICLYLEQNEFGPQSSILFKIHCNIFHQCLSLHSGLFLSGFQIKFCMHFFSFPIRTTCPDNFVRVGLTEEQQKIADNLFSFRDSNHVPRNSNLLGCWCFVTSCLSLSLSLFGSGVFFRVLCSQNCLLVFHLGGAQFSHPCETATKTAKLDDDDNNHYLHHRRHHYHHHPFTKPGSQVGSLCSLHPGIL